MRQLTKQQTIHAANALMLRDPHSGRRTEDFGRHVNAHDLANVLQGLQARGVDLSPISPDPTERYRLEETGERETLPRAMRVRDTWEDEVLIESRVKGVFHYGHLAELVDRLNGVDGL